MRRIIVVLVAILLVLLISGCRDIKVESTDAPEVTLTATPNKSADPSSTPKMSQIDEQTHKLEQTTIPPQETKTLINDTSIVSADGKEITVHNANELLFHLADNKHFKLMPGGDYDIFNFDSSIECLVLSDGQFFGLNNVIFEGIGDQQVDIITNHPGTVLSFYDSSGIVLKNLNIGHKKTDVECLGAVVSINGKCRDITIQDCTLFGCGRIGFQSYNASDIICENTVIKDCTERLVELNEVNNFVFNNCIFHARIDEPIVMEGCDNIVISNSELSGEFCNYPNIFVNNDCITEEELTYGPIYKLTDKSFSGLTLQNNQISGLDVLKDLNNLFPNTVARVYTWRDNFFGDFYIGFSLSYSEKPDQSEYIRICNAVRSIGKKYNHVGLEIRLYDNMNNEIFLIDSVYTGYLSCYDTNPDIGTVLNDGNTYLTIGQAGNCLRDWFPKLKSIDTNQDTAVEEITLECRKMCILHDTAYYYIKINANDYPYYFSVNAVDGSVARSFDGDDFAPVKHATQEQIDIVLAYLKSTESSQLEKPYRAYVVSDNIIEFNEVPYILRDNNGILIAEQYDEWTGN